MTAFRISAKAIDDLKSIGRYTQYRYISLAQLILYRYISLAQLIPVDPYSVQRQFIVYNSALRIRYNLKKGKKLKTLKKF